MIIDLTRDEFVEISRIFPSVDRLAVDGSLSIEFDFNIHDDGETELQAVEIEGIEVGGDIKATAIDVCGGLFELSERALDEAAAESKASRAEGMAASRGL